MRQARDGMRAPGFRRAPPWRPCDAECGLPAEPLSCLCPTVDLPTLPCASASEQRSDVEGLYGSSLNKLFRYFPRGRLVIDSPRPHAHATIRVHETLSPCSSSVGKNGGDALP